MIYDTRYDTKYNNAQYNLRFNNIVSDSSADEALFFQPIGMFVSFKV
jgi:hypothetical protein